MAWVMSRFPRLTETFVLYEILTAQSLGLTVDVYPLLRESARLTHPDVQTLMGRVRYTPFVSWSVIRSQLHWLRRAPGTYIGALWSIAKGTWGSVNFFFGALSTFPKVAHVARMMKEDGVAHVHCHFANHPALAGLVIHRLAKLPFSFTGHGSDIYVDRHMLKQKVAEAEFVIAISEYGRRCILEESGFEAEGKVYLVHTGVDTEVFRPPAEQQADPSELSILCVATLAPWKGQQQLIEACRLLAERGVPFRCALVGGAGNRDTLIKLISEAGLGVRVTLTGWKTRPEVAALMREAHVVVAPSVPTGGKREGIPATLMEALASGAAVVASRVGGIPELIEDEVSGLVVPPGDPVLLAEALERLHVQPDLRRRLAENGRQRVERDYELSANTAKVVRYIRAAVRATGPSSG